MDYYNIVFKTGLYIHQVIITSHEYNFKGLIALNGHKSA